LCPNLKCILADSVHNSGITVLDPTTRRISIRMVPTTSASTGSKDSQPASHPHGPASEAILIWPHPQAMEDASNLG
jgi:hypothetical protein